MKNNKLIWILRFAVVYILILLILWLILPGFSSFDVSIGWHTNVTPPGWLILPSLAFVILFILTVIYFLFRLIKIVVLKIRRPA